MTKFKPIVEDPDTTIQWLNSLTPVELLTEANKGFKIRDIDHNLIAELQGKDFADEIINVMLYFVLARSRGLRFDEVRDLAASLHGVETVEDAMILAEDAFLEWQKNKLIPVKVTNSLEGPGWKLNF